jgi:hypothetical protein
VSPSGTYSLQASAMYHGYEKTDVMAICLTREYMLMILAVIKHEDLKRLRCFSDA